MHDMAIIYKMRADVKGSQVSHMDSADVRRDAAEAEKVYITDAGEITNREVQVLEE